MASLRVKSTVVAGILFGFLFGIGLSWVFPFGVVPSTQDIMQRRFTKIENFFTVYYECTGQLPPYKEFRNTRGGAISWSSFSPDGKTVMVRLVSTCRDSMKDGTVTDRTFEHSFSLVGDASPARPSP